MRAYLLKRLALFPLILLGVSILSFLLVRVLPGDAALTRLGATGSQCAECRAKVERELGLDKPVAVQYVSWLTNALRGDFGMSVATARSINPELRERSLTTLQLGVVTIIFTLLIGIPVGALSAVRSGSALDYVTRFFSILGLSIPSFWLGTLVVVMPAIWWQWTPVKQWVTFAEDPLTHIALFIIPAAVLSLGASAYVARLTRSTMLDILYSDFVRTARAKGLRERRVVFGHVLRNTMITLLTVIGLQFGLILGGSIVIESIFAIPGLGSMTSSAVLNRDYPAVQAVTVVIAGAFLLITLIIDVAYAWVDPRIKY